MAARWHNALQAIAEQSPHGIPVTISTDPRHAFIENAGASFAAKAFSQWPESLGLAALRDADLVREFGDIARQEYCAVGIRAALHPTLDLATEPRWARQSGTFGQDPDLVTELAVAYLKGFQQDSLGPGSVACTSKHFPGGGPQKDGEDAHFPYGREQVYPGGRFADHLKPFPPIIEAGTAAIMPYYGMPIALEVDGEQIEEVGFGYNKQIVTGLLREQARLRRRRRHRLGAGQRQPRRRPGAAGPRVGGRAPRPAGPDGADHRGRVPTSSAARSASSCCSTSSRRGG